MKVDVTFVNFPATDSVKNMIAAKIEQQVGKFSEKFATARAVFSTQGFEHQVRISLLGGNRNVSVHASDSDVGRSVDMAIDKLGGSVRKLVTRRKHHRSERVETEEGQMETNRVRRSRGSQGSWENAFDRYEEEFVRDFDDRFENVG
jgi:ribosomal subunit interface protein